MYACELRHRRYLMRLSDTTFGILCVAASAATFSTAGLFTRIIELDVWTLLFWRGSLGGLALLAFIVVVRPGSSLADFRLGRAGWLVALCSALSTILFIHALRLTSVADVTITFATTPFFAAGITWFVTGRWEKRSTLIASLVAFCGVLILASQSLGQTHSLAGILLALLAAFFVALLIVVLRHNPAVSFLPAACISGFLCALMVLPAATPFPLQAMQVPWLVAFGVVQFALGLLLLVLGAQRISATRSGLISSVETPLAPMLVWAAFGEAPSSVTLVGGAIVMSAVISDILLALRDSED